MSMVKRQLERIESRGFGDSDKLVCHECTQDYALKNHIKKDGLRNICDYCGKDRKCVRLDHLMYTIMSGIKSVYDDANETLGWDSSEGGFLGSTYTNYELIHYEFADELGIDNENLLNDIANLINDSLVWCDRYIYEDHEDEYDTWSVFTRLVKEKIRYVFYKVNDENDEFHNQSPSDILDIIGGYAELLNLVTTLNPKNKKIYRGRTHKDRDLYKTVNDFAPPPPNKAKANRMSPEGIPMFYGAFETETALSEIYSN